MKKIFVVFMCALMLVSFVGCSGSTAPEGMQNAASENAAFYLYVPKSWTPNTSSGVSSAFYSSVDRSNVSVTCTLPGEKYLNVEQYVAYTTESLGKMFSDFKVVSAPAETKLGGAAALSFDYTATVNGVAYKYRQIVSAYKDIFYVFTYTSIAEVFDSHLADVDGILAHFIYK
jgi:hypothetical protein